MLVSLKLHNTLKNNLFGDYKGSTKFAQGGMCFLTLIYEMYELCPNPRVSGSSCPLCVPVFPCFRIFGPTHTWFPWLQTLFPCFLVWKSVVWPRPGAMPSRRSIKIVDHNQGWHPAWRLYAKIVSLNTDATLKNWLWSVILIFGME